MSKTFESSLKGHFLMAMPGLTDPNFLKTVTCICEHSQDGAMGLVINRQHPALTAKDIFEELHMPYRVAAETIPVYTGGPVHLNELFILHGPPLSWHACLQITPALGLSNTPDIVQAIAQGTGPRDFLICLGCAGWAPGQLEVEIRQNAWLTGPIVERNIFHVAVDERWREAVRTVGIDPDLLNDTVGHA